MTRRYVGEKNGKNEKYLRGKYGDIKSILMEGRPNGQGGGKGGDINSRCNGGLMLQLNH